jgi:hypothetical protein
LSVKASGTPFQRFQSNDGGSPIDTVEICQMFNREDWPIPFFNGIDPNDRVPDPERLFEMIGCLLPD